MGLVMWPWEGWACWWGLRVQERERLLDPLELELHVTVSCRMGARSQTQVLTIELSLRPLISSFYF